MTEKKKPPKVTVTVTEHRRTKKAGWYMPARDIYYKEARYRWTDEHGVRHNEYAPPRATRWHIHVPVRVWVAAAFVIVTALVTGGVFFFNWYNSSYQQGYRWGSSNTGGSGIFNEHLWYPRCSKEEMASAGAITDDPNEIYGVTQGAGQPNDDYTQWRAGCQDGLKSVFSH